MLRVSKTGIRIIKQADHVNRDRTIEGPIDSYEKWHHKFLSFTTLSIKILLCYSQSQNLFKISLC